MMLLLVIGLRNIRRNLRRSVTTILAVAMGALAMLAFGGFMAFLVIGFRTQVIEGTGHLAVMRKGFFEFGSGNPAAYGIGGYQDVIKTIAGDKVLGPMINVITPTINMYGLAANFAADSSRTFYGFGVVPSDRQKMRAWDEAGVIRGRVLDDLGLVEDDEERGVIGTGLARILGLCEKLKLADCYSATAAAPAAGPAAPAKAAPAVAPPPGVDLAELASRDTQSAEASPDAGLPRIDLLSATAGGSPNVVSLYVARSRTQGARELDDVFVSMHLALAQQLLYGRGEHKATSLVIQLHHYADMDAARQRLNELVADKGLEVRDFTELTPMYNQVIGFFGAIFVFIAVVMGVIVLFTVVNTMSMAVMERTNEIGTTRALGVRRAGIRRQFLVEGALLGVIGAAAGVALTEIVAFALNLSGLRWTPPGQAYSIPFRLLMSGIGPLIAGVVVALIVIAIVAALIPANRAARMSVVDALRHV